MNCEEVRELLGPFTDYELPVEVSARINGHIVDCLACQDERTALTLVRSHMHDYRKQLDPPGGFMERLQQNVDARLHQEQHAPRFHKSWYMAPLAAAAAVVVLYLIPHHAEQQTLISANTTAMPLSAREIYAYEHKIKNSESQPVEYNHNVVAQIPAPPQFKGWSLAKTSMVSVNSTNAIKYIYIQSNHGSIKTMTCYQFAGGAFDSSGLTHHLIDGRSICCGAQDNISLVYWRNINKDFVLVSEQLPRADLLSIALNS